MRHVIRILKGLSCVVAADIAIGGILNGLRTDGVYGAALALAGALILVLLPTAINEIDYDPESKD